MVNFNQFLKQAQGMQKKMQEMQEQLTNVEYEAKSGGGLITVTVNGRSECLKINIDPSLMKAEEKELLEDLLIAALNEAKHKVDQESNKSWTEAFGGMTPPLGFKLPF